MARKRNNTAAFAPLDTLSAMNHAWWDDLDIVSIQPTCLSCAHFPVAIGHGCLKFPGHSVPAKVVCGVTECLAYTDIIDAVPY
jgi:hypothetical protein